MCKIKKIKNKKVVFLCKINEKFAWADEVALRGLFWCKFVYRELCLLGEDKVLYLIYI